MNNDTSDVVVELDWGRLPTSRSEESLVSDAFSALLAFYQGMPSVAERYGADAVRSHLCSLVTTIVLNAWDAYLVVPNGRGSIRIENNDEAAV